MRIDKQIDLAAEIAGGLPEVTRNDWVRWTGLARRYGLDRAIGLAERMAQDPTIRPAIQRTHQLIATAMKTRARKLNGLSPGELEAVFGYIGQFLAIRTVRGALHP